MVAKGIECVYVQARRALELRAHLVGEHAIPQALRFAQFSFGMRPRYPQPMLPRHGLRRIRQTPAEFAEFGNV